jgi:hypothetical protein
MRRSKRSGFFLQCSRLPHALAQLTIELVLTNMSDKTKQDGNDADPLEQIEEHEYPGGLRLAAIVGALVLSIFLASLDTVC